MTDSKNGESLAATEPNAVEWMQSEIAGLSGWLDPNHCGLTVDSDEEADGPGPQDGDDHFAFPSSSRNFVPGNYPLPSDEGEQTRLDIQHTLTYRILEGKLYLAPIGDGEKPPKRVLDLATGSGIWARDFAEKHPNSEVLGVDLSSAMIELSRESVPENCHFAVGNIEDEWPRYGHKFDYIHARYVVTFIKDIPKLLRVVYDNLAPGGHVELMEGLFANIPIDDSFVSGGLPSPVVRWNMLMLEGIRKFGTEPTAAKNLKRWLQEAGFVNIQERKLALPINTWPKGEERKIQGAMNLENVLRGLGPLTTKVLNEAHGWSTEEAEALVMDVQREAKNTKRHGYLPVACIWGQKPPM